jgi:quercetin dioxygenase-like cupin family protein
MERRSQVLKRNTTMKFSPMNIDARTNQTPPRAPIEVTSATALDQLRQYWSTLPMTPKVLANREQAPQVEFPGQDTRILLTGEESAGTVTIFDNYAYPGFVGGDHYQPNEEEYWFILDGELEVTVGSERVVAKGGSFAFMPRNCTHAFKLLKPTHLITVNAPAGHDRAFEALDKLFRSREPVTPDAPVRTVANHQMMLYLDDPTRHPIDATINSAPRVVTSKLDDVSQLRTAWSELPMIPKFVASRDLAQDVSVPGLDARLLLSAEESAGRLSVLDVFVAPGYSAAPTQLASEEQWWYVIDGELDVTVGNVTTQLKAGGFAFAPRGTTHAIANNSGKPAHMVRIHSPAGYERTLARQ